MTRPVAEIVTALVCTGLTQEQTILLLELVSVMSTRLSGGSRVESPDSRIERRREWDREYRRKRRLAEAIKSADLSTRQVDTSCDLSSLLSEEDGNREVKKEKKQTELVEGRGRKNVSRGTHLSADAKLSDTDRKFAADHGVVDPEKLWAEFVDYWIGVPGSRGSKINWSATWRNRVRAVTGHTGAPNGQRGSRPLQDDSLSISKAAGRLAEAAKRGEFTFGPRPSLLPREDAPVVQLLSERRGS